MVNAESLDNALIALIEKKNELNALHYADDSYDDLEEALHDLEDSFIEKYGKYLEKALQKVHDEYCSDTDVLLPIAYIAKRYEKVGIHPDGKPIYEVDPKEGVWVEADKYPGKEARLVLVPCPARIILAIGKNKHEVWKSDK